MTDADSMNFRRPLLKKPLLIQCAVSGEYLKTRLPLETRIYVFAIKEEVINELTPEGLPI